MSRDFERRLNEALNKNKLLVSYQARLKDAAESTNQIWLEIKEEEKEPQQLTGGVRRPPIVDKSALSESKRKGLLRWKMQVRGETGFSK